jgi:hypothetical protein
MLAKGTSGGVTVISVGQLLAAAAASQCRKDAAFLAHAGLRHAAPDKSLSFQYTASFASTQSLWKVP